MIKNFGKTPAMLLNTEFDKEIEGLGRRGSVDSIKGSLLAPNQRFITAVSVNEKDIFTVFLTYKDMKDEIINQSFTLNLGLSSDLLHVDSSNT